MKRIFVFSLLSCAVLLSACAPNSRGRGDARFARENSGRYGYQGEIVTDQAVVESQPVVDATAHQAVSQPEQPTTPPPQQQIVKPVPAPVVRRDSVTATPVAGKPGFVKSPYASGLVDVRGFPPGTEVKDPYSGKVFLVP